MGIGDYGIWCMCIYNEEIFIVFRAWVKGSFVSSRVHSAGSRVRSAGPTVHLPSSGSSNGSFGLENVFLGAFGVVHLPVLWNMRHIALKSLMGAWLFKTPVGPQAHYLSIPFSFTPSRKRKQSLEVPYRKLNLCGTGKSSTASQVASMAGGMIYSTFLFRFCFRVLFRIFQNRKFLLTVGIRAVISALVFYM